MYQKGKINVDLGSLMYYNLFKIYPWYNMAWLEHKLRLTILIFKTFSYNIKK